MIELQPCPRCARHVASEPRCPFCGEATAPPIARQYARGRFSRAAVFAGATLAAGCGGKQKKEPDEQTQFRMEREHHHQNHPCSPPDPQRAAELEKQLAEAQTDEERQRIEQELAIARMGVCAPYGAPPARRRVV